MGVGVGECNGLYFTQSMHTPTLVFYYRYSFDETIDQNHVYLADELKRSYIDVVALSK
jgi:hypothetical protein